MPRNDKGATDVRLTFLLDPEAKLAFGQLCAAQDVTVSQMLRRLIAEQLARAGYDPRDEPARGRE